MDIDKSLSLSLYIHIPFCRSKCGYCDFNSYCGLEGLIPEYVDALAQEIRIRAKDEKFKVSTIYFGGGTPSLLSIAQLKYVIETCNKHFLVEKDAELTLEANPGTVTYQWFASLRGLGFNRLSLGFQSLNGTELNILGRIHSANQAIEAYAWARKAGFENINIDLIYGLPDQSNNQWLATLDSALPLAPEHFSLYPLTLEETTPLGRAVESGVTSAPDPDKAADMYRQAEDYLACAGYEHYELSNWSLQGKACRHNLTYWENHRYIGLGAGAHSFIGSYRIENIARPEEYISRIKKIETETGIVAKRELISPALELSETIILGLRLDRGVEPNAIKQRFGVDILDVYRAEIKELKGSGLLDGSDSRLRLTRLGRLLGNEVFLRFLPKTTC